jgi:hypothetical protein
VVNTSETIDKCVEELTRATQEASAATAPKRRPVETRGPLFSLIFRIKYV